MVCLKSLKRLLPFLVKKVKNRAVKLVIKERHLIFHPPPDIISQHFAERCSCGATLDKDTAEVVESRQVFDLPEPKLLITEHQKMACTCSACGQMTQGQFPDGVHARVQYGYGVRALVILLNIVFKLPLKKIHTLFNDLYGYGINAGTIIQANRRCYEQLEASEQVIQANLLQSIVAYFDETGLRVTGKLHWLHTCCNKLYTYLFIHANRGKKALLDTASLLPKFTGWAMHDCWQSYFKFVDCQHAICGAHLLRELYALEQRGSRWATWFKRYLLTLYHLSDKGTSALSPEQQAKALKLFEKIWTYADQAEPPPQKSASGRGRPKATKGRNLLNRLKKYQTAVYAFAFQQAVPFTNNEAERALRPAKIKQKVAGSFRTLEGSQIYARILGFVATTRKHQINVFKELKAALQGRTFLTHPENS